ncbi:unnamed protein product [Periconia digitata]|uniref:ERCC1-like central domain-containing protein n=1 Tax=Periconia digitata TaxID=1303443 RepID=A0A9W4U1R9_9PLEO|nr:unnamed protein product [Periconia digitata]
MDESDVPPPAAAPTRSVQQPKPQALPPRAGPSSILVSPRQKGNPILNSVRAVAWEYSDIPADYVLGATTCALFLSLKYHRLHPEYVYNRIRDLKGQYQLRILLVMVDIDNHEESLRELSKTSLVNNVTVILAWSAQEAGRYLELFKTFEHAAPTTIKTQQSTKYADTLVDFITVPRSVNKTDAVGLVSNFGSIRTAVNATPEEIGLIAGWGEKKVQRWCNAVREPFRLQKAAKRGQTSASQHVVAEGDIAFSGGLLQESVHRMDDATHMTDVSNITAPISDVGDAGSASGEGKMDSPTMAKRTVATVTPNTVEEAPHEVPKEGSSKRNNDDEDMSAGIMAALAKLRKQ